MSGSGWSDLKMRVISGVVLAAIGLVAVISGGWPFGLFMSAVCGFMLWELLNIASVKQALSIPVSLVASAILFLEPFGYIPSALVLLVGFPAAAYLLANQHNLRVLAFAFMISASGLVIIMMRFEMGLIWVLWLIAVVVATDVAGYFGGRLIGGPKFWPSLSPKKTWSGTASGWVAAACVGAAFDVAYMGPFVAVSVAVSFASQMGDIAESALKRKFGIKDSSNLIPGHGGFLDRFDGMIAATLVVGIVSLLMPHGLGMFHMGWR